MDKEKSIAEILDALREGLPEYAAAARGGIVFKTWWEWKTETPGLPERCMQAKKGRIILYEDALHKAALKGNVTACLTLLRKESKEWRELLDGRLAPMDPNAAAMGMLAAAGAASIINMLSEEKRRRVKLAMAREGILEIPPPNMNGHSQNGNGNGTEH